MINGSTLYNGTTPSKSDYTLTTKYPQSITISELLAGEQYILILGPYLVNNTMIYSVYVCYNPVNSGDRLDFMLPLYNTTDVHAQSFRWRVTENQAKLANEGEDQYIILGVNHWKDAALSRGNCAICHFNADQISNEVSIVIK